MINTSVESDEHMIVNDDVKFEIAYRRMMKRGAIMTQEECLQKVREMAEQQRTNKSSDKDNG